MGPLDIDVQTWLKCCHHIVSPLLFSFAWTFSRTSSCMAQSLAFPQRCRLSRCTLLLLLLHWKRHAHNALELSAPGFSNCSVLCLMNLSFELCCLMKPLKKFSKLQMHRTTLTHKQKLPWKTFLNVSTVKNPRVKISSSAVLQQWCLTFLIMRQMKVCSCCESSSNSRTFSPVKVKQVTAAPAEHAAEQTLFFPTHNDIIVVTCSCLLFCPCQRCKSEQLYLLFLRLLCTLIQIYQNAARPPMPQLTSCSLRFRPLLSDTKQLSENMTPKTLESARCCGRPCGLHEQHAELL